MTRLLPRLVLSLLLWGAAPSSSAAPASVTSLGVRQVPLMDEPEYVAVTAIARASGYLLLASTRDGVEVRTAAAPGGAPAGVYRAAGPVRDADGTGDLAVLFRGAGGVDYLDLLDPAAPRLMASLDLPALKGGAVLGGGTCAAFADSSLYIVRLDSGRARLLETIAFPGDRRIVRALTRGDSLLVVAARTGALPRLYLSLYRIPAGAAGASLLVERIYNGRGATDADWDGRIAFVSDGNAGVHSIDLATGAIVQTIPMVGSRFVRGVAVNATSVFAVGAPMTLQRFVRRGALAESLQATPDEALDLEPVSVATLGSRAVVATRDVVAPLEPDEVGRSQLEFPVSSDVPLAPIAPVRHQGRARRVVASGGLVYVAAYTGGLRIYRAGGADTSLVGVLPHQGTGYAVDLVLDAGSSRVYLAARSSGLEVVDVADPAAPLRIGSLALPGPASAVALVDDSTVAVAHTGAGTSAGVTLVDVTTPTAPVPRGSVHGTTLVEILAPRALAVRDTVIFVADDQQGVLSVGISNRDAPVLFGLPSGAPASDLDLQGDLLLVGSRGSGLQVLDAADPAFLVSRSAPFLPPITGVTRQAGAAVACLGERGVALVDLSQPSAAVVRSVVASPGVPRDAAWIGDTLLIAAGTSIERFLLTPLIPASPALTVALDEASALGKARIAWDAAPVAGQIGWNVFRDRGIPTQGTPTPGGVRITESMLDPSAREAWDGDLLAGVEHRYRLEAVFGDGRVQTVAEGALYVPSRARLGRPYPSPFRADRGPVILPYRVIVGGARVTLRVVDVRGRTVREVRSISPASGGFGTVSWDGRDRNGRIVPSGVYYLHVRGPGLDDARSVLHLR